MTPERWKEVEEVFDAAVQLGGAQRAAYLLEACRGDEELLREVESLLKADSGQGSFMGRPILSEAMRVLAEVRRPSLVGRRIGRYEVLSLIGAGGMGEVYRARDTQLGRSVALKVLPARVASERQWMARFIREAKAASSLNHPNIITIYEIGQNDGVRFIATEYIEGVTLRERMSDARLGLSETLDVVIQVASALAAAHEEGIVHRDIKPENIMLRRRDGLVKVLDFGLAKLTEQKVTAADPEAATTQKVTTHPGMVMGTVRYMSPEQARGLTVDGRTDVWSLGVVLYEVATVHAPFTGETMSDVLVSILDKRPAPLADHLPKAPPRLQQIVERALDKDAARRYQSAEEMRVDLSRLKRELDDESGPSSRPALVVGAAGSGGRERVETANGTPASTGDAGGIRLRSSAEYIVGEIKRHKRSATLALALLVIVVAGAAFGLYSFVMQSRRRSEPAASFQTTTFMRLTSTGRAAAAAISPDGKYIAYVLDEAGQQSLLTRQIITSSNVKVIAPAEVQYQGLTFSPDGSYIFCVMRKPDEVAAALYQLPALGGAPPRKLLVGVDSPVTFSPDGKRIAFVRNYPGQRFGVLMVADADGGREQQLAPDRGPDSDRFFFHPGGPAWSPDGRVIACAAGIIDSAGSSMNVAEVRVEDGTIRPISSERWWNVGRVAWFSDGSGLVMAAQEKHSTLDQIWRVSYPGGETRRITNDLDRYLGVSLSADSDALVTVQADQVSNVWIAPGGDARRARPITFGKLNYYNPSWTPDGRIVYQSNASGHSDIWMMGADGKNQRHLTVDGDFNFYPTVSPDGRYVVFSSNRGDGISIWRMDSEGGDLKQLAGVGSSFSHPSPDGRWVVYTSYNFSTPTLWKVAMDGGEPAQLTDKYSLMPAVSPDGKNIACLYRDEPTSPNKVAIIPFEGGQPVRVFDLPIGSGILRWTPDGGAVAYVETRGGVSNLWGQPVAGGVPKQLTDFTADQIFGFDWSRDGEQLAIARGDVTRDVILLRGLR